MSTRFPSSSLATFKVVSTFNSTACFTDDRSDGKIMIP